MEQNIPLVPEMKDEEKEILAELEEEARIRKHLESLYNEKYPLYTSQHSLRAKQIDKHLAEMAAEAMIACSPDEQVRVRVWVDLIEEV